MLRRIITEEGMLVGQSISRCHVIMIIFLLILCGSSGTAMAAAIKLAKELTKGKRIVVIQADNSRNYM